MLTNEQKELIRTLYAQKHGAPYIAKQIGCKTGSVSYFLKKEGLQRSSSEAAKKYNFNENFFETIDTEEKAYWLGFLYADGYVTSAGKYSFYVGLSINSQDRDHLIKFNECLNSNVPIHDYISASGYKVGTPYSRLLLSGETMYKNAIKQGVVEHKTDILKPPKLSKHLIRHFIRGYFDGDGCLTFHNKKKKTTVSTEFAIKILSTKEMLDYFKDFIEENNIAKIKRYYKRKPEQTVQSLEISGNQQVKSFTDLIYQDAHIYLDRKYKRYQILINYLNSRVTPKGVA